MEIVDYASNGPASWYRPFGTGWWWKQRSGGRSPSQREQLAYKSFCKPKHPIHYSYQKTGT